MRLPIASLLVLLALSPVANGQSLRCEGRVFLDRDGDGLRDRGEPGIADVGLSDGVRILRSEACSLKVRTPCRGFWNCHHG